MTGITGRCLCEGVQFVIDHASGPFELCHCRRCRRSTGSAFAAMLTVPASTIRVTQGEELIARYDAPVITAPPAYRRTFCRRCGSPLPDLVPGVPWVEVPAGLLDGDPQVRPDKHIYVEHAPAWLEIRGDLPRMTREALVAWRSRREE